MARKAASPSTRTRRASPPRNRRRFDPLVPAGAATSASPVAGRIVCASARTAAFTRWVALGGFTRWVALGGAGGRACGLGRALVAGRCCGGADVVEAMTACEVAAELTGWVVALLVVGVLGGGVGRATGAGSGPSLVGALTGGRSGPAARTAAGAAARPSDTTTATRSTRGTRASRSS